MSIEEETPFNYKPFVYSDKPMIGIHICIKRTYADQPGILVDIFNMASRRGIVIFHVAISIPKAPDPVCIALFISRDIRESIINEMIKEIRKRIHS